MSLSPGSGTDLRELLALLRRRRLLFLGLPVAGLVAGFALLKATPPEYTATTQVLVTPVGPQDQTNQVTNRQRESLNLDTEAQVAQSAVVAAKAAQLLKVQAAEPVEVSVPPNSAVLWISVTAADPATAAAQSRAYAQAYLANRTEAAQAALTAQQKTLLGKLKQVNTALDKVIEDLAALRKGTAEFAIADHRQSVLNRQVYSLTMKYDAQRTVAVTPGSIISQATPPAAPSSPSLPLYLGTGLMAGLLLGSGAAYARDRLDTALRTPADVERLIGLPVLADLTGPADHSTLHDLTSTVLAACPGQRLLVRAVPADLGASPLAGPLSAGAPLSVLSGADVSDLARADAALLLIGLGRAGAGDVAAAVRHLSRHNVPIIGVVCAAGPVRLPEVPQKTPLGKLVAGVEMSAETTPMKALTPDQRGTPT
ncbi:YveK family protein [Nonomuraea sediminis]|uniref:YveK family protein n=1 Tax=Nonomuraea sediminis TaxID=2835864 RepID=UPI001BDCDF46|nr:Wzz/FepE/Etk N-terminal domain-containing protein [Nonomuraea sediminis]